MAELQSINKRWLVVDREEARKALKVSENGDDVDILDAFRKLTPCFRYCKFDMTEDDPDHILRIELHGADPLIMPVLLNEFELPFGSTDGSE